MRQSSTATEKLRIGRSVSLSEADNKTTQLLSLHGRSLRSRLALAQVGRSSRFGGCPRGESSSRPHVSAGACVSLMSDCDKLAGVHAAMYCIATEYRLRLLAVSCRARTWYGGTGYDGAGAARDQGVHASAVDQVGDRTSSSSPSALTFVGLHHRSSPPLPPAGHPPTALIVSFPVKATDGQIRKF